MLRLLFVAMWLCFLTTTGLAQFVIDPITYSENDCSNPALAAGPDDISMLAFVESGGSLPQDLVEVQIMVTTRTDTYYPYDPVVLNTGEKPEICWAWDGFHVAFVSGETIFIYHSNNDGQWDLENYTTLAADGPVRSLEILGATWNSGNPHVYLAVHTASGSGETNHVQFASRDQNGWSELATLDLETHMASPQMAFYVGSYTQAPQLFFQGGDDPNNLHLKSSILVPGSGWSDPVFIMSNTGMPSPILNEFDVSANYGTGDIRILGLGAQPTCPCGSIHLHSYISVIQDWQVGEVTAHYADLDWPKSPKAASSYESLNHHLFWYQEAVTDDFTPWNRTLEYRIIENGEISDQGDFLDEPGHGGNFGSQVALTVDPMDHVVLAWTRTDTIGGVPQPERIWIARHWSASATPEVEMPKPQLQLSAWPNPFNPLVNIAFELDKTQAVQLDIFDARGRRVASLLDGVADAGKLEITWNAQNDSGQKISSGVYFVRLISGGYKAVMKVVLAE